MAHIKTMKGSKGPKNVQRVDVRKKQWYNILGVTERTDFWIQKSDTLINYLRNYSILTLIITCIAQLWNGSGRIRRLTVAIRRWNQGFLDPGTNIVGYNKPVACLHVAINDIKWVFSSPKIKTIANKWIVRVRFSMIFWKFSSLF